MKNMDLLSAFISAKKIEGCSEKTLCYYRNTIERLLLAVEVTVNHITTSDIRRLLGHVRIDTTLHYAIVNQNNVKLAHKKYLG